MANELKIHPRGSIALGNGDLMQATMARFEFTNNAKLKHTLRKSPSGFVNGTEECSGSIDVEINEDGPERTWYELVRSREIKQFRFKIPASDRTIEGVIVSVSTEAPLDDAIKMSINFIGKITNL